MLAACRCATVALVYVIPMYCNHYVPFTLDRPSERVQPGDTASSELYSGGTTLRLLGRHSFRFSSTRQVAWLSCSASAACQLCRGVGDRPATGGRTVRSLLSVGLSPPSAKADGPAASTTHCSVNSYIYEHTGVTQAPNKAKFDGTGGANST